MAKLEDTAKEIQDKMKAEGKCVSLSAEKSFEINRRVNKYIQESAYKRIKQYHPPVYLD